MFIVCNYLDVENKNARTDGFVVENCSEYNEALEDYVIVCREHRIENVIEWARNNMGNRFDMFRKQLEISKEKAMVFVKAKGGIKSYTEEMIEQAGGLDTFMEIYCKPVQSQTIGKSTGVLDENNSNGEIEQILETVESESDTNQEDVEVFPQEEIIESEKEQITEIQPKQELPRELEEPEKITPVRVPEKVCNSACIYNSDGTFKGFTDGQVLTMLNHLKTLDKRIALNTLNPDYVLSTEELDESQAILDSISPSVYKAFFLFMSKNVTGELDRIRTSVLLDQFASFVQSLNK